MLKSSKNEGIDMVLAIGGGSNNDCSKLIAAGAKYMVSAMGIWVLAGFKMDARAGRIPN